jgi:hypothetical protein
MEETHRRDRLGRTLQVNVSYLARGLRRCRRTIQRYLAMLEREGLSARRGHVGPPLPHVHRADRAFAGAAVSAPSSQGLARKGRKTASA